MNKFVFVLLAMVLVPAILAADDFEDQVETLLNGLVGKHMRDMYIATFVLFIFGIHL